MKGKQCASGRNGPHLHVKRCGRKCAGTASTLAGRLLPAAIEIGLGLSIGFPLRVVPIAPSGVAGPASMRIAHY